MPNIAKKISLFSESAIANMSHMAEQYGAVNLSEGFPDFPPPKALLDRLEVVSEQGPHQYSIDSGAENLRQALAAYRHMFTGQTLDPEKEVIVTCGGTEALMTTIMTIADPGDKIIIFSPYYEAYGADVHLAGAEPVYVPLHQPDFTFDADELEDAFRQHPKAIILCNPSNPCGKVFSKEELQIIASFAEKYDTFVIVDEVYEHIVYAPTEYVYFSTLPGMYERTITCSSLSKTYSITGWRLGYIFAPPQLAAALRQIHVFMTISAPSPLQEAAVTSLSFDRSYYESLREKYTKKRQIVMDGLDAIGIPHNVPQGAFYMLLDISSYGYDDDNAFCADLIRKVGVALVPGSTFFHEDVHQFVRLQFAVKDETLYEALNRLEKISCMKR